MLIKIKMMRLRALLIIICSLSALIFPCKVIAGKAVDLMAGGNSAVGGKNIDGDGYALGSAMFGEDIPDLNMERVSRAFDIGNAKTSDTILRKKYHPGQSISVRLRKYMGTLISIPDGARIRSVVLGDSHGFSIKPFGKIAPNELTVYPKAYDIDSNLIITDEDGRVYTFYLRSDPIASEYVPHFAVFVDLVEKSSGVGAISLRRPDHDGLWRDIIWSDDNPPQAPVINQTEHGKRPEEVSSAATKYINYLSRKEYDFLRKLEESSQIQTGYRMFGDSVIAPNAVWDDHKQTYLSFRKGTTSQRIPNLYRVSGGYGVIANYHYRDGFLITDIVSEEGWMLVDGEKIVCIKAPKKRDEIKEKPLVPLRNEAGVKQVTTPAESMVDANF